MYGCWVRKITKNGSQDLLDEKALKAIP